MAGLSHYTTSKASTLKYEPVFLNQFEITITPPAAIPVPAGNPSNGNIMLEQVISINGLGVDKNPGEVTQKYKNAKRYYSGAAPTNTYINLDINFEINLDTNNSMYAFKVLRQWSDLIYNPLTGGMGLKVDYTGTILIKVFDKAGNVFRQITCQDVFPMEPIKPMDLDYTGAGTNIYKIQMKWAVDWWNDIWV